MGNLKNLNIYYYKGKLIMEQNRPILIQGVNANRNRIFNKYDKNLEKIKKYKDMNFIKR